MDGPMEWLQFTATALSALAAALAWAAKLWWSKEYAAAKDETIKAKDAEVKAKEALIQTLEREIETFREFTPMKIREYFLSVTAQLNEYNDSLEVQVEKFRDEIAVKDSRIGELSEAGAQFQNDVNRLLVEKDDLERKVKILEDQETKLRPVQEQFINVSGTYNSFAEQYPGLLEAMKSQISEWSLNQSVLNMDPEVIRQLGVAFTSRNIGTYQEIAETLRKITMADDDNKKEDSPDEIGKS
jgi:chromosome segregation ATPase